MKLNEAKIKKKRHKSLDPWRLYVPDWSRTSGLLLRRSTTPIIRRNPEASVIAENPRHYWIYRMVHVVSCVPRYSGSDWGFSYFSLASLARIK